MSEFSQSLGFDLSDTLTGDLELLTYFFKCAGSSVFQTESQLKYLLLTVGKCIQYLYQLFL